MASQVSVKVADIVGSPNCVDTQDGQAVHDTIATHLENKQSIAISFEGVERVTTAFLNAAIGQLYNEFTEDQIRQGIRFVNFTPVIGSAIAKVIERAKEFFRDADKLDQITKGVLES